MKHDIALVIDRLVIKPEVAARLTDSVETALKEGKGLLIVGDEQARPENDRPMSEKNACLACGLSFGELTPASFSFNNPLGMCTECSGLGTRPEMDPDLIVPDPTRSIREGAIEPWQSSMARGERWTAELVDSLARAFDIDLDAPYGKLPKKQRDLLMNGTGGRSFRVKWDGGHYDMEWEGLVHKLMRGFKSTQSEAMRRYYMKFFSDKPCTA